MFELVISICQCFNSGGISADEIKVRNFLSQHLLLSQSPRCDFAQMGYHDI